MITPSEADSSPEPIDVDAPSADLGRSYGSLLDQQAWEVDAIESTPSTDFVDSPEPPGNPVVAETAPPPEPVAPTAPPPLPRLIEALLFVGGPPLTGVRAGEVIRGLTAEQFAQAINALNQDYKCQGRPYVIQAQDQGFVLTLRPRFRPVLEKLYGSTREARLSPAAIDVLALVAYRQPATKQEIDSTRGAESGGLLRQLVRRGLVAVVTRGEAADHGVTYGTTPRFLELFRLRSLEDLPQTQDLQKL